MCMINLQTYKFDAKILIFFENKRCLFVEGCPLGVLLERDMKGQGRRRSKINFFCGRFYWMLPYLVSNKSR